MYTDGMRSQSDGVGVKSESRLLARTRCTPTSGTDKECESYPNVTNKAFQRQ